MIESMALDPIMVNNFKTESKTNYDDKFRTI